MYGHEIIKCKLLINHTWYLFTTLTMMQQISNAILCNLSNTLKKRSVIKYHFPYCSFLQQSFTCFFLFLGMHAWLCLLLLFVYVQI